ncbi:hypothetical protein ABBQ38_002225 [Trebouxia sp. C0009 RCD-2024]
MQPNSASKRSNALNNLKRQPPAAKASPGVPRFSAATSHEQNDAYMQDFDAAYTELEALSLARKGKTSGIAAHRPQPTSSTSQQPHTNKAVGLTVTAPQPSQPLQTIYPADILAGWRAGPQDPAGRVCNVSELPLMCSSINWASQEVVVGSSDHALYVVDVQSGKKRRTLYTKTAGHAEWVTACQYLPDGRVLSGGMDSLLCLWEANSNRWDPRSKGCACDIAAHVNAKGKGAVGNIISAGSASGSLVVTAGADGTVKAFDVRSPLQAVSQAKLTDFPYSLAVAGGLALCGCGDGSLLVIDLSSGQTLYALGANKAAVRGVHASRSRLVCMGDDGSVYMYNFA